MAAMSEPKNSNPKTDRAGLTQEDLAELIGVDRVSVSRAEGGRKGPVYRFRQFVLAVWPELSEAAKKRVRERLSLVRKGEEID